jgi:hypothetical protein
MHKFVLIPLILALGLYVGCGKEDQPAAPADSIDWQVYDVPPMTDAKVDTVGEVKLCYETPYDSTSQGWYYYTARFYSYIGSGIDVDSMMVTFYHEEAYSDAKDHDYHDLSPSSFWFPGDCDDFNHDEWTSTWLGEPFNPVMTIWSNDRDAPWQEGDGPYYCDFVMMSSDPGVSENELHVIGDYYEDGVRHGVASRVYCLSK